MAESHPESGKDRHSSGGVLYRQNRRRSDFYGPDETQDRSGNDLFFKMDGNAFTLSVGIRFVSGHGKTSSMDSMEMIISIMIAAVLQVF
jgi:hypothetical protein